MSGPLPEISEEQRAILEKVRISRESPKGKILGICRGILARVSMQIKLHNEAMFTHFIVIVFAQGFILSI